ncbi:MAG TPA: TonB-dependent receptor, partial [Flavisolibacter sp.]
KDKPPAILTETAVRFAKAFGNTFAFKINLSYLRGIDWTSHSKTDQNPNHLVTANPLFSELNKANPAADAWNRYGDENNNAVTISGINYAGGNKTFLLRRTGYWEKDLVNPVVDNMKADVALQYRLSGKAEFAYSYRAGKMDGVFQRGNKIQLDNVTVQNHRLEWNGGHYFVRSYLSIENTGDSYNVKPLADNLQLTHLSNSEWGARFKTALQSALDGGVDLATAMQRARTAADAGRAEPGTAAFDRLKDTITRINNWDHLNAGVSGAPHTGGAWLKQKSRLYHTDAQYDFGERLSFIHLLVGADLRIYEVIPDGNNFVDFSRPVAERNIPLKDGRFGNNVYYKKYGAFVQATKTFLDEKLKLYASLRFDHNLEFTPKLNPRIAVVYTLAGKHNFRISFQNGFRFPALFEALSFVNNGNVRRVGGLAFINEGLGYLDNSYTLASVNTFNAAVNKAVNNGTAVAEAALANKGLLQVTHLSPTRPERIHSVEAGYKAVLLNNKLVIDADVYLNQYDGFLGQVEVAVPLTSEAGTDAAVLDMLASNRSKQTRYRVFTNAINQYTNYGTSLGITWNFFRKYLIAGNVNYNAIVANKKSDVFLTAFNTPDWTTNLAFGNRELFRNFGFNLVWRWQSAFVWESPLANGTIPAYYTFDAQVNYRLPKWKATVKAGASNLFNRRYIQYAAGPTIGGLYYTAITLDGLLGQ